MHTAELDVGAVVAERYRVIRSLGTGGMAAVYLARDEALGRDVAIKIFPAAVADDSDATRRRDEVTLLAGLSHPGLVVLFDAALDAHPPYLTMEYVEGETLASRLSRGPLPPDEAEALVIAVADALAFVHARGIVHRDIKPANILLPAAPNSTGSPAKLADFGIARLVDSAGVTATGTVIGTAAYISPEQASGAAVGPPSDIYALGLVLIECLTGSHPFPGSALESAAARLSRQPDLTDPALAAHSALLQRMTAQSPGDRPLAEEVVADLSGEAQTRVMAPFDGTTEVLTASQAVGASLAPPVATAVPSTPRPRPVRETAPSSDRRRRWALAIGAAAVLIAITIVTFMTIGIVGAMTNTRSPGYPAVEGPLGIHLEQLQESVADTGLEDAVLSLTNAAAEGRFEDANGLLDATAAMVADGRNSGLIPADRADIIDAAIIAVRADLAALLEPAKPTHNPKPEKDDKKDD